MRPIILLVVWVAWALIGVGLLSLAINLYFYSLTAALPGWLTRLLARTAAACGIEGGSCKRVADTRYARLFAGMPNVYVGIPWCLALLVLSGIYLATGAFYLWLPCLIVALASVAVALYLIYALLFVLKDP